MEVHVRHLFRRLMICLVPALLLAACSQTDSGEGINPVGPSRDGDGDGIVDAVDRCPGERETLNGVFDRDGCPDTSVDLYLAARSDADAFFGLYFNSVLLRPYVPSRLQMFTGRATSACGPGQGPFYCGADGTVYLDQGFMDNQLRRIGDFAPAMIVAHEVGHHTQNLLGLLGTLSIQKELQADCLAGAWAASAGARGLLDAGDFQEAAQSLFEAGDQIGLPWFAPGAHGTPLQRQQAFTFGFQRGAFFC
jgi:predicted metalloprotease